MSSRFDLLKTPIAGLCVLQRKPIGDSRGYFERMFCSRDMENILQGKPILQSNHTLTVACGTLRGMHYQLPPHTETKLVSCLRGEVFDVAVDLRSDSPTFLHWHGEILSAENHKTLVIPDGFAHGFQTLCDDCEMLYFHTAAHQPEAEAALHACDPHLGITWPLPIIGMSPRDSSHPFIDSTFKGIQP